MAVYLNGVTEVPAWIKNKICQEQFFFGYNSKVRQYPDPLPNMGLDL